MAKKDQIKAKVMPKKGAEDIKKLQDNKMLNPQTEKQAEIPEEVNENNKRVQERVKKEEQDR